MTKIGIISLHCAKQVLPGVLLFLVLLFSSCQKKGGPSLTHSGSDPAKPWVFWYWMHGAVSREGITADLEAMKEAGIGGAYLFTIKDTLSPAFYSDPVRQLTPEWWQMVKFAFSEAGRLGLEMAFNVSDGFATAGGPWITPELSMQRVVWADTIISGKQQFASLLPQPESNLGFYRDIAVFAFPSPEGSKLSSYSSPPEVTCSLKDKSPDYLTEKGNSRLFESKNPCWIQYAFAQPFSCRSVVLTTGWDNYQANRLIIEVSDDGITFRPHTRLNPYRHGWQDIGVKATHGIEPVTARYFRFVFDPEGTEPGSEDLDNAKWSPALKISGIELSGEAKIHQYEGKSGAVWRIASRTTAGELPDAYCINPEKMINLTSFLGKDGVLRWEVPEGKWMILRMGHTPTGQVNATAGGGLGSECDKLNPEAVSLQFDRWFGEVFRNAGPEAEKVVKIFHVDSWECGSQNWSPVFAGEFRKRRGYDLVDFLPVMAGIPMKNAEFSEKVLYDVRLTISELLADNFYQVMADKAKEKNCLFSAECVSPVFTTDGMLPFRETGLPMGEFWFRSPSHDKPNDILDAVSAGHIYGKKIIQAEAFTEIRLDWDEHPGMLKPVGDLHFANGINRFCFHVFAHNPWTARKPGMTLDKVGTFLQRDQTWWKPGKAWVEYITRCQKLLQSGIPVTDIAVFTGEEIPSRALLPDRLTDILPGIIGQEKIHAERERWLNQGLPVHQLPAGVTVSSHIYDPADWPDPLRGYKYDSFNKDALLRLAEVKEGKIVLPGGASYRLLVVPGSGKMNPDGRLMSLEVAEKLLSLAEKGATILVMEEPVFNLGHHSDPEAEARLREIGKKLFEGEKIIVPDDRGGHFTAWKKGSGYLIQGPYQAGSFIFPEIPRDFEGYDEQNRMTGNLAWTHRKEGNKDVYFISNQRDTTQTLSLSFRVKGKLPEVYLPLTGEILPCRQWESGKNHTTLSWRFAPFESIFVIFEKPNSSPGQQSGINWRETRQVAELSGPWTIRFDHAFGGPDQPVIWDNLKDWSVQEDSRIRFYSGTAVYSKSFDWKGEITTGQELFLELEKADNLAEVTMNGHPCGVCWTSPYRVRIDQFLQPGINRLEIAVTNTWHNRLLGDHKLPPEKQITWTTAPYRLEGRELLPAGLTGKVVIAEEY